MCRVKVVDDVRLDFNEDVKKAKDKDLASTNSPRHSGSRTELTRSTAQIMKYAKEHRKCFECIE